MKVVDRKIQILETPTLQGSQANEASISLISDLDGIKNYKLVLPANAVGEPLLVIWKMPAINVKGVWSTNSLLDKRIRADWEEPQVSSSISVDAPVMSAFGHDDSNRITFACNDLINTIDFESAIREEDNFIYCSLTFFGDGIAASAAYEAEIRIDYRDHITFSTAIQECGTWLEAFIAGDIQVVPEHARLPLYSTWYSYHQDFTEEALLNECRQSKDLGYELIIIDDGWQTLDDRRGYNYTGDWEAERFADMAGFVDQVHALDMKIMLWYSVPFCGILSKAYQRFKGKFLTESHDWAPVFDPRFPEVRAHLVSRYVYALETWNIDGFKLDFIDDFKVYPETETQELNGRDVLSVNKGVDLLIAEIKAAVVAIKPNVLIEFRQKYISPVLRSLGNMFRAFDCPNDTVMNRVRTTDVKLLCGHSAVHSDMFTWHKDETVEIAALQLTSILFSVPQLSVRLNEVSALHKKMIRFYTQYWLQNRSILLDGSFEAIKPLSNYPELRASDDKKLIIGLYEDIICDLESGFSSVDIINGKLSNSILIRIQEGMSISKMEIIDCMGEPMESPALNNSSQFINIKVPANGLIQLSFS